MKITPISKEAADAGMRAHELYLASQDALELLDHVQNDRTIDAAVEAMNEARVAYDEYLSLLPRSS
jgi:hypothetical protein